MKHGLLIKMMDIKAYLARIGYTGSTAPNFETLRGLHRAHLTAIPYENFDIHLGRPIQHDEAAFFDKLVRKRRGGWCFEMNGLFAWALRELGFRVTMLSGSVRKEVRPESGGDHLMLLVELEQSYLADVGFGDGFLEPLPLQEGEFRQDYLNFRLEKEGEYWICHNQPEGGAQRYDFRLVPYELEQFRAKSQELQTSPASGFVRTTVAQRYLPDGSIVILRGATLSLINREGVSTRPLESETEFQQVLAEYFDLDLGDTSELWPRIWQRHLEWIKEQSL